MLLQTVTVIGANGTMGTNISGLFAALGGCCVYLVSRRLEDAQEAAQRAALAMRDETILSRMVPVDYSDLPKCVPLSDLVFESVSEDSALKKSIIGKISGLLREDCLVATGTSCLSVTDLAQGLPQVLQKRFFGIHFFNPPATLTLCELITTKFSDKKLACRVKQYLQEVLVRQVIKVQDIPAFLSNRIGIYCLNRAAWDVEANENRGGIDYLDNILGGFTGRTMPPLKTLDFIGLDVYRSITEYVSAQENGIERTAFVTPPYLMSLIAEGKLGRKTGKGQYYSWRDKYGEQHTQVYDFLSRGYREGRQYTFPFAEKMMKQIHLGAYEQAFRTLVGDDSFEGALCMEHLLRYVLYALAYGYRIGCTTVDIDAAMAEGYNWCPPLAMLMLLGGKKNFCALVKERLCALDVETIDLERLMSFAVPSTYDWRRYIKAKK